MNNSAFRNLVNQNEKPPTPAKGSSASKPSMLGSRARPSVPMTPRSVTGYNVSNDFARQVAEHTRQADGQPALKKFRSATAPKGSRLAKGYEDRTSLRREHEDEPTTKEKKLKELEGMVKSDKIDQATFEKLRDSMGVGGDLGSTHLVKGLDRKLLERIRRGEDLNAVPEKEPEAGTVHVDVDEELDSALDKDLEVAPKPDTSTKESEEVAAVVPQSVTRDEILQRLKEGRNAQTQPSPGPEAALSGRFKKVPTGEKSNKKKFVESVNGRRRQVLVITDKQGNTKRKTKWLDREDAATTPESAPLGMQIAAEVAAKQKALLEQQAAEEQDDDDIFAGVGANYDPLKGLESDSDGEEAKTSKQEDEEAAGEIQQKPRNYFGVSAAIESKDEEGGQLTQDSTMLAALKRAAGLRQDQEQEEPGDGEVVDPDQAEKRKQFMARLKQREREDAGDLDLAFGESRFGDEDDEEAPVWDGDEEGESKQRKRRPKKRKGDKDNVSDIMKVLDGRKKA